MTLSFKVPDEYLQGFVKAGQSLWQAWADAALSPSDEAAAAPAALVQMQVRYWQQQLTLWTGALASPGAATGGFRAKRGARMGGTAC